MKRTKLSQRELDASFGGENMSKTYPPMMTVEQLGRMLNLRRSTVYSLIAKGGLNFAKVRPGRGTRFWRDDVIKWIFSCGDGSPAGSKSESDTKLTPK